MMGGVSPETCGTSNKYGIINFDKMLHLVGFFCMNYVATDLILGKVRKLRNVLILIIA
jgi:hypothetical protein